MYLYQTVQSLYSAGMLKPHLMCRYHNKLVQIKTKSYMKLNYDLAYVYNLLWYTFYTRILPTTPPSNMRKSIEISDNRNVHLIPLQKPALL